MKIKYETSDGKLFETESDAEKHEAKLKADAQTHYEHYIKTHNGISLLKTHTLDEYGIWQVLGEDPNCDLGGYHFTPNLGYLEGNLKVIIEKAVTMKGFWSWGGGGEIRKVEVTKL